MSNLPCIICQDGDVYSNIICEDCEFEIERKKEVYEEMISLVYLTNGIFGNVSEEICQKIEEEVKPIYEKLISIKIYDKNQLFLSQNN